MPAADMAEKHGRILGELAEFGLALARKLHDQGIAAETPEETAELARAFHSVSRSVRQTLALEARLAREAARQDREDRGQAERQAELDRAEAQRRARAPYEARKQRIGGVLERLIYSEHEDEGEIERLNGRDRRSSRCDDCSRPRTSPEGDRRPDRGASVRDSPGLSLSDRPG